MCNELLHLMEGRYYLKLRDDMLESLQAGLTYTVLQPEGESHADLTKPVSPSYTMNIPLSSFQPCLSMNLQLRYFSTDDAPRPDPLKHPHDKP